MLKNVIFAVGEDESFGNFDGTLPWGKPIKEDMLHFRHITQTTGAVVMGYNTFKSLPTKLDKRTNIVLTKPNTEYNDLVAKDGSSPDIVLPFSTLRFNLIDDMLGRQGIKAYSVIGGVGLITKAINSGIIKDVFATLVKGEYNSDIKLNLEDLNVKLTEISSLGDITFYHGNIK